MKETLAQLIIRDILTETSGEIDLYDYENLIEESIKSYQQLQKNNS
jgi:hypothetical protein